MSSLPDKQVPAKVGAVLNLLRNRETNPASYTDVVSSTFCTAKWDMLTLNLHTGESQSCHHPKPHQIRAENLDEGYGLHNTPEKLRARQQMEVGERPAECDFCWAHEDNGHQSDRHRKSFTAKHRIIPILQSIEGGSHGKRFLPSYLEIAFDNICNFQCIYCSPRSSSKWATDVEKNGYYELPTTKQNIGKVPAVKIKSTEDNPYRNAFYSIFGEWLQQLETLRFTGGEPTYSKDMWYYLNVILETPAKYRANLKTIAINTNLGAQDKIADLAEVCQKLIDQGLEVIIYTSAESTHQQQEYIRKGMDYEAWSANLNYLLRTTEVSVSLMPTINALCYASIDRLYYDMLRLRAVFGHRVRWLPATNLNYPACLSARHLPPLTKRLMVQCLRNLIDIGKRIASFQLYPGEREELLRLIDFIQQPALLQEQQSMKEYLSLWSLRQFGDREYHKELFPTLYNELEGLK